MSEQKIFTVDDERTVKNALRPVRLTVSRSVGGLLAESGYFGGAMPGGLGPLHPFERDTREPVRPNNSGDVYAHDQKFRVNKQTHRIRFENETENDVTVVIEPKV